MAKGLYLPDGTFQAFSPLELSSELATRINAGVTYTELDVWLNTLPDPDPVLRKRGDDASILQDLSADEQVTAAMLSRKNRVLNCSISHCGLARWKAMSQRRKRKGSMSSFFVIWSKSICAP